MVSSEDRDQAAENERLRRENRILKEERGILKNHPVLREPKAMRFRFVIPPKLMDPKIPLIVPKHFCCLAKFDKIRTALKTLS